MDNVERIATIEERTIGLNNRANEHSEMLNRIDDTLTQLRIYTQSTQRMLESHEIGIKDINKREIAQVRRIDERFDVIMEKLHVSEITVNKKFTDERETVFNELKNQLSVMHSTVKDSKNCATNADNLQNDNIQDIDHRLSTLESWKWKAVGVLAVVVPLVTITATQFIRTLFA